MAKLIIAFKDGGGQMELDVSQRAATRVLNRYVLFLQQGAQATPKFPLDGEDAGVLALNFENVLAIRMGSED